MAYGYQAHYVLVAILRLHFKEALDTIQKRQKQYALWIAMRYLIVSLQASTIRKLSNGAIFIEKIAEIGKTTSTGAITSMKKGRQRKFQNN